MKDSQEMNQAKLCLANAKGSVLLRQQRQELAIELAGLMLLESKRIQSFGERRQQAQLARMMNDSTSKAFVTSLTDQCFRSRRAGRVADQIVYLIKKFGIPRFLSPLKRFQLMLFRWLGRPFAKGLVPLVKRMVRKETASVIIPGEAGQLSSHMRKRRREGVGINLNHIGEAILGEEEASRRLQVYLKDLANPEVEYISIKASTIFSQIHLLGRKETIAILGDRLKRLYRAARENIYIMPGGKQVHKFVNLDMEEYRDLHLTVELFRTVLDDAEFYRHSAGIVLQSYLPDAFLIQQDLTVWAMQRVASGGAPIKVRIVKGANLAMEKVEGSLKDWPQAPYLSKEESDANFKRMIHYGCEPERAKAVRLGIASHNLFDIAYAMILRVEKGVEKYATFEMLEGMAPQMSRVVQSLTGSMLLYCPASTRHEFQNAVAYLMRRLDENTAPENFLRHAFEILPGTREWQEQAALFAKSCEAAEAVSYLPRRQQNRFDPPLRPSYDSPFDNEADTDWSLPHNVKWAEMILRDWAGKQIETVPLVVGQKEVISNVELEKGEDPSYPGKERYRYALGGMAEVELALTTAAKAMEQWGKRSLQERMRLIDEAAHQLRCHRADLIGAMVLDGGKTVMEADVEVSEAIDFASYYRHVVEKAHALKDLDWQPKGPVLVAPPWNFPCSIPASGILAALSAGNTVIFKPAPEAVLVGWQLVNIFWEAGIGKDVLQFFCCRDDPIGSALVQDERLAAVVLTGATSTARSLLKLRPGLDLVAETGGKNAMIITSLADRDLAIKDLVQSAFGHAGQKCSACSLAILEKEVYEDLHFRRQLKDAAASLKVGSHWDPSVRLNPLIRPPSPTLLRGLTSLEEGEEWLLEPRQDRENPNLWTPGIKLGVKPGTFTHQTELFGPVLGIMCAENLEEAIQMANGTPYGLTSGIHTLDEREQKVWSEQIVAGNCYINRTITGAVVRRQPFGGCKDSGFGRGAKAGGPNYPLQLMIPKAKALPQERAEPNKDVMRLQPQVPSQDLESWHASVGSYAFYWENEFSKLHDPSSVSGEDNFFCYVPHPHHVLRIQENDAPIDILRTIAAAFTCRAPIEVSAAASKSATVKKISSLAVIDESEAEWIERIRAGKIKRVRLLSAPSDEMQKAFADAGCYADASPVLANGRIELLHFLREVSISNDYHRYGYLGLRER